MGRSSQWWLQATALKARYLRSDVAKGASFTFTMRIYGAALAFFTQLYLARAMGAEQLGIFVFAWTWLSALAFLVPLGFDTALVRFLASFSSARQWCDARGVLNLGFIVTLTMALAVAALGLMGIALSGSATFPYTSALIIALLALPALALVNLHEGIARGFHWIYQVSLPTFALRPSLFLLFVVALAIGGRALGSNEVIAAMALACVLTWGYQYWRYRVALAPQIVSAPAQANTQFWLRSALPMVLVVSFEQLLANTDIVMLGIMTDPSATGIYNIGVRIVGIALFIFFAVSAFAAPRIAVLHSENKTAELVRFAAKVRLAIALPTLAGLALLALVGVPLLRLFGEEFVSAYVPMLILGIAVGARAVAGPIDNLLTMTGEQNALARVMGVIAVLNLLANAILIPRYGIVGAACATTASVVTELIWVSRLAGRHVGFRPWLYQPVAQA